MKGRIKDNNIKHLRHSEINKQLWDRCIEDSSNRLIYAFSWYLDIISPNWEALVIGDYNAVMPLPAKSVFGIKYLFQPWLSQQLGMFSNSVDIDYKAVLAILKKKYLFGYIHFNSSNQINLPFGKFKSRINLILELNDTYLILKEAYSKNHKRNIGKTKNNGLEISHGVTNEELINLFNKSNLGEKVGWKKEHINQLLQIMSSAIVRKKAEIIGVYKDKDLVSAVFILIDKERVTYLFPVTIETGLKFGAQFFIVDYLINKYSSQKITLDFEGSSVEGIARFYKGFGAKEERYSSIFFNLFKFGLT